MTNTTKMLGSPTSMALEIVASTALDVPAVVKSGQPHHLKNCAAIRNVLTWHCLNCCAINSSTNITKIPLGIEKTKSFFFDLVRF